MIKKLVLGIFIGIIGVVSASYGSMSFNPASPYYVGSANSPVGSAFWGSEGEGRGTCDNTCKDGSNGEVVVMGIWILLCVYLLVIEYINRKEKERYE